MRKLKINQEITSDKLMLIDEEGDRQGLVSRDQALYLAYEKEFDLVLINENSNPPIARLMDYGKYLYNQTKQIDKQKAKSRNIEIKEIRLGIKIGEHDLENKISQAQRFLSHGDKVKISIRLKGREMMFQEKARLLIEQVKNKCEANYEKPTERLGTQFSATIARSNK